MLILDCESRNTALASVAQIYRIDAGRIDSFFAGFDLEEHYERFDPPRPGDEELRRVFESEFSSRPLPLDRACWFHLTRAPRGETFAEGVLPLTASIDKVWMAVLKVFQGTRHEARLASLRASGVPGFHYHLKVGDPFHAGPYAMLVRDVASRANEIGNHDYLWLPEIMEDICTGYQERFNECLAEHLSAALVPTVVKFWSATQKGDYCVQAALNYLYRTVHNKPLNIDANTGYDGNNVTIPPNQIICIEQPA